MPHRSKKWRSLGLLEKGAVWILENQPGRRMARTTDCFGRPAEHHCGLQQRTIARATRKSEEYRRVRGHTYCPGAAIRASIWRMPNQKPTRIGDEGARFQRALDALASSNFDIGCYL
jgi:hypothetical protein